MLKMRRFRVVGLLVGLLAMTLLGCDRHREPIPPDAQVVHVVATLAEVRLDPATVRAGDIYLVLDEPQVGSIQFVEGPLSDADLERLAHGDTEGTRISGIDARGCSPDQNAADRGLMGPCGNVMKVVVNAGKYAILGPGWVQQDTEPSVDPTADPAGFVPPLSMAVLVVEP
jgi:hypothetical protein